MKRVVAYCRVSTDGQTGEDRYGIESQQEIINKYCAEHDMKVMEWYIDEGESGTKESRPELDRLLFGELSNPPIEAVVVAKSDRMARDIKLYFYYMMLLEKRNVSLISATEEVVNDDTGLGNVYKCMMMFVAEQERNNITRRTSCGRARKAHKGGYSGGRAPMGYRVEHGKLVINPDEVGSVRFIFKCRDDGMNMLQTCRALTENGYKTRFGKEFSVTTVKSILNNERTYRGEYRYGNTGEWVPGEQEAIL